jgi:excinuclease ABC subunit C
MSKLTEKLKNLPTDPGVYFYKNAAGKIIYIGKAAVLKNRVSSYFQKSTVHSPKNVLLVADIVDVDWITVGSEVEALFLESEMIKRYRPKYNIDLKDDKNWNYIKITTKTQFPVVSYIRRPLDDGATYFGPFTAGDAMKRAMKYLRHIFPYVTHDPLPPRACLQAHIGLCPNPEEGAITSTEYRRRIRQLMLYLRGEKDKLLTEIERDMQKASKHKDFEGAARARDQLRDLKALSKQMIFGDKEMFDLAKDQALVGLAERLDLKGIPRRIEAYDISHLSGTDNVASMVVFTDGVPHRDEYRKFKMRLDGNNDFAHMYEVISRRFSTKNLEQWPKPDLLLIDGGKGQLGAALVALDERGINIPAIGLAKREEEIIRRTSPATPATSAKGGVWDNEAWVVTNTEWQVILLPKSSHVLQLLQRVRDEAHRFAVTYQSVLRGKRQVRSLLDDVPGIGPATRKKLIKSFGSLSGVRQAEPAEIAAVVGSAKAAVLRQHLK